MKPIAPTLFFRRGVWLALAGLTLAAGCARTHPVAVAWKPLPAATFDRPLTIPDCIGLAHQSQVNAVQWQARLAAARAAVATAREIPNPSFKPSWEDLGLHSAGASLFNVTYMASFPIFFWWTRQPEGDVARAGVDVETAGVWGEQVTLDLDIGTAWYEVAAAQRKATVAAELARQSQDALTAARENLRLGLISDHELRQAEAEALQGASDAADAAAAARAAGLALAFALGSERPAIARAADRDGLTSWALPSAAPDAAGELPPPAVIERAAQIDPSTAQTRAALQAAQARLKLEQRKRLPLADAAAGAGMKREPEGWGKVFSLDLPIPLFNWNSGAVAQAQADVTAAQAAMEKARREVVARVAANWDAWRAAQERQSTYTSPLEAARRRLADEARELFRAGQITYAEMLQALRDRDQAALASVDQWQTLMVARWKLRTDVGETGVAEPSPMDAVEAAR